MATEVASVSDELGSGPTFLADPGELYFAQHHAYTVGYFQSLHGRDWTRVHVSQTPHFAFVSGDADSYAAYIGHSWRRRFSDGVPDAEIEQRCSEFDRLLSDVTAAGGILEPVLVCQAPDGCLCVVDGNHRTAVALALGLPLPARKISAAEYARRIVKAPDERYGTKRRDMPYQTIYHGREPLVPGRRHDLLTRYDAIAKALPLAGKTILDLGSNYGMSSYFALALGNAKESHLVEHSPKITTAAVRLAVLLNCAGARFHVADLREDVTGDLPVCDIAFSFSIMAHIGSLENVVSLLRSHAREAVVFETHMNRDIEPPIKDAFDRTEIGRLGERRLFLLTARTAGIARASAEEPDEVSGRESSG